MVAQAIRSRPNIPSIETLGRSRLMNVQRWVWMIGANDDSDERLLEWAGSFSRPPSVEVRGGQLDSQSHSPERRAICVVVQDKAVSSRSSPETGASIRYLNYWKRRPR